MIRGNADDEEADEIYECCDRARRAAGQADTAGAAAGETRTKACQDAAADRVDDPVRRRSFGCAVEAQTEPPAADRGEKGADNDAYDLPTNPVGERVRRRLQVWAEIGI